MAAQAPPVVFSSLANVAYHLSRMYARQARTEFRPVVAHPFAAIIMAIVFVESYFNEVIELAARQNQITAARSTELRNDNLDDKLSKFLADLSNNQTQWDRGQGPYQAFKELLILRNELVHYKPQFIAIGQFPNPTIELVARRLPHEWLGRCDWTVAVLTADVADWACRTARGLVEEFHRLRNTQDPWQADYPGWRNDAWTALQ